MAKSFMNIIFNLTHFEIAYVKQEFRSKFYVKIMRVVIFYFKINFPLAFSKETILFCLHPEKRLKPRRLSNIYETK